MEGQAEGGTDLAGLAEAARDQPIVSDYSDLAARILQAKHGIETIDTVAEFCRRLSDPTRQFESDVIIRDSSADLEVNQSLTTYRPPDLDYRPYTGSAYTTKLNKYTAEEWFSWQAVEEATLNQSDIASRIVSTTTRADVVALVIVDGLSYKDWCEAGNSATPVYVDCPTITACGYPNVIHGGPSGKGIATRLHNQGFKNRLAFTYWEKEHNDLTNRLHEPFSPSDVVGDVEDFSDVTSHLGNGSWDSADQTYLQITLTGPERVAHKMKENPDVTGQVELVEEKLTRLWNLLTAKVSSARVFATADHGILWRMDAAEDFIELDGNWNHNKRRHIRNHAPSLDLPMEAGRTEQWGGSGYFRLDYPYLLHSLRSNEPGTHGGFSYQESVVPLIEYP